MARLVLLVAVVALICGGFYSWSRKQGLTAWQMLSRSDPAGDMSRC